jgi:nucleoside-diphosphate kinase
MTSPHTEVAFLMIKPDGVSRRLIGEIMTRLEATDLRLVAANLVYATDLQAGQHYERKSDGSSGLTVSQAVAYLTSGPVFTTIWKGRNAVAKLRSLVGSKTDPYSCSVGTIRRDFAADTLAAAGTERRAVRNVVHSSHDAISAGVEIGIWFGHAQIGEGDE